MDEMFLFRNDAKMKFMKNRQDANIIKEYKQKIHTQKEEVDEQKEGGAKKQNKIFMPLD